MKKLLSLLLAVCMCFSVGVMLAACDEEHMHTYKAEWSNDATHHWHECEGEDCAEVSDKAEHTWNNGEITTEATADADGVKTFTCTACGQTKTEPVEYVEKHSHTYKTEWSKDATHHWHECEVENCLEVSNKAEHTWNNGEITTEATADADGVKTFTCTACGQTKTESLKYVVKATVTAEEWVTALNFSEYKNFEYIQDVSPADNGWIPNTTVKVTEDKVYIETDYSNYINKEIYSHETNGYFRYQNENGTWNRTSVEQVNFENCYKEIVGLAPMFDYEDFVFDNASNSYKAEQTGIPDFMLATNVTVVFEDGKVVSIQFTTGDIQMSITATYGNAEVALPAIVEQTEGITESEWNAMLAAPNFENYTFTQSGNITQNDGYTMYQFAEIKITLDRMTVNMTSPQSVFFDFTGEEAVMQKNSYEQLFLALLNNYDSFEYDPAEKVYKNPEPVTVDIDMPLYEMTLNIVMENGKISLTDDGKLLQFVCDYTQSTITSGGTIVSTAEMTWVFYDYGTTVITHTYKTEWSKDATHHWHECEDDDCTKVSDKAEHTWNNGEITTPATAEADGVKTFTCTACGQTKTESVVYAARISVTKEEWRTTFAFDYSTYQCKISYTGSGIQSYMEQNVEGNKLQLIEGFPDELNAVDYMEQVDGGWYYYNDMTQSGDFDAVRAYTKRFVPLEDQNGNEFEDTKNSLKAMLSAFVEAYDSFDYDIEQGCYVAAALDDNISNVTVFMLEGKINQLTYTQGSYTYELKITYEDNAFSLPEVAQ